MSKVSFRARALDSNRPLQLHFDHEISDLSDYASISRSVPRLPSGMEKDEETEHHLQEALFAQQQFKSTDLHAIPIPEIDENANKFKSLYHTLSRGEGTFRLPRHYIRVQAFALEPGDNDAPDYDLDSDDEAWLAASKLPLTEVELERMLEQLERHSDHKVVSLKEAKALLRQEDGLTTAVYDYWLAKRIKHGHRLSLAIKAERRDGSSTNDPYVAFRRRTEKMQTRKHRKNDEASYEKMLKLRRDMERACSLIELLVKREEAKSVLLDTELRLFQRRWAAADFDGGHLRAAKAAAAAAAAAAARKSQQQQQQQHQQQQLAHDYSYHDGLYQQLQHQQQLQQQQQQQQYQRHHHRGGGVWAIGKRTRKQPPPLPAPPLPLLPGASSAFFLDDDDEEAAAAGTGEQLFASAGGGRYVWCRRRLGAVYAPARSSAHALVDAASSSSSASSSAASSASAGSFFSSSSSSSSTSSAYCVDAHGRRQFSLARLPWVAPPSAASSTSSSSFRRCRLTAYVGLRFGRGGRLLVDRLPVPSVDPHLAEWDAWRPPPGCDSPPPPPTISCAHSGEPVEEDPLFDHRLPAYELCDLPLPASAAGPTATGSA